MPAKEVNTAAIAGKEAFHRHQTEDRSVTVLVEVGADDVEMNVAACVCVLGFTSE